MSSQTLTDNLKLLWISLAQHVWPQTLGRTPEPDLLTDKQQNVEHYNSALLTRMPLFYDLGLEVICRARPYEGGSAIDLGCGPGFLSICLARYLGYHDVTGIDLSKPMIEVAKENAKNSGVGSSVTFQLGNMVRLDSVPADRVDLTVNTLSVHHLPDLDSARDAFLEMDRITKPSGLVMILDMHRFRSQFFTELGVRILGRDFLECGLKALHDDFYHSMFAAWTRRELQNAIPQTSKHRWCHLGPFLGLPPIQIILGLPVEQKSIFLRPGFPSHGHPFIESLRNRWEAERGAKWVQETYGLLKMQSLLFALGRKRVF